MKDRKRGSPIAPVLFSLVAIGALFASACIDEEPGIRQDDTAGNASSIVRTPWAATPAPLSDRGTGADSPLSSCDPRAP